MAAIALLLASRLSFIRNPLDWSTATVEGVCQPCPARSVDTRRHRPQRRHGRVRLRISLQDELERQFVWIEGVAQIGEGTHQHGEFVPQLPELERGCSLDDLQCGPGVSSHGDNLWISVERPRRRAALTKLRGLTEMRSLLARHSEERQAPGRWLTAGSGRLEGRICEVSVERASGAAGAVPRGPFRMKRFQFRLNAARYLIQSGPRG